MGIAEASVSPGRQGATKDAEVLDEEVRQVDEIVQAQLAQHAQADQLRGHGAPVARLRGLGHVARVGVEERLDLGAGHDLAAEGFKAVHPA